MNNKLKEIKKRTERLFGKHSNLIKIYIENEEVFNDNNEFAGFAIAIKEKPYSNCMTENEALDAIYCLAEGFRLGLGTASTERN